MVERGNLYTKGRDFIVKNQKPSAPIPNAVQEILNSIHAAKDDPEGSYTGVPAIPNEMPLQDADDL